MTWLSVRRLLTVSTSPVDPAVAVAAGAVDATSGTDERDARNDHMAAEAEDAEADDADATVVGACDVLGCCACVVGLALVVGGV